MLGADHVVEAQTVNRGLRALGYDADRVQVLLHQFVTFGESKMSTRAGNYITLDDLINEVGADVVRYFMLARSPNSHLEFDFDLAKEQSKENPVYYIQNAHVRCCGILRQVAERGLPENWDDGADLNLLGEAERLFVVKMLEFPEQLLYAHDNLAPHQIAFYALDLARQFHPLYDEVRVLHTEVPEDLARARLRFYRAARVMFARLLALMGMDAPERM
ncbi:MAG: class I tRNA ligase family protein [Anaerolineae bacterium]|nr:class I tRNA ligase family protein [Anaerolineae bacterium]